MDMFRQIAPKGIVNKQPVNTKIDSLEKTDFKSTIEKAITALQAVQTHEAVNEPIKATEITSDVPKIEPTTLANGSASEYYDGKITSEVGDAGVGTSKADATNGVAESKSLHIKTDEGVRQVDPADMETQVRPDEGEAVAASSGSVETVITHEEMSGMTPADCPFLNRE
jgi:hypothetical protein